MMKLGPTPRRFGQRALDGPTVCEPCANGHRIDSDLSTPLRKCLAASFMIYEPVRAPIVHLFQGRCPTAIVRRVWTAIVFTLKRVFSRGAWPHVIVEVRKGINPAFTNRDALGDVFSVRGVRDYAASTPHRSPRLIFSTLTQAVGLIRSVSLNGRFLMQAPTRLATTTAQCVGWNRLHFSARTLTPPARNPFLIDWIWFSLSNHRESPKDTTGELKRLHLTAIIS